MMFEQLKNRKPGFIDWNDWKLYAVLVPLVKTERGIEVLFEKRAGNLKRQPGEICFPGGSRNTGESAKESAIRETMEELLIQESQIDVIAQMDTFVPGYGQQIKVFLGELKDYEMTFSDDEVEEVFLVPLQYFMDHQPKEYVNHLKMILAEDFPIDQIPGGRNYPWYTGVKKVCFYEYEDKVIWGLTARIMKNTAEIIEREGDYQSETNRC